MSRPGRLALLAAAAALFGVMLGLVAVALAGFLALAGAVI